MTEQEEFEFRLRLENEQAGLPKADEEPPLILQGMIPEPTTPPTMTEYLLESAGRGLTTIPAVLGASSELYGIQGGEFPSELPPQGLTQEAMDRVRRGLGLKPEMRPATGFQRYAGAFTEAALDPLNLLGGVSLTRKLGGMLTAGAAGAGGEFGGEIGQQVGGLPGQVFGGILFSLMSGGATVKAGTTLFDKAKDRIDIKDLDVADLANVEGISRAKDLVEQAVKADPSLRDRLNTIQKRVEFVTGEKGALALTGLDNITFRSKLEDLARGDAAFATDLSNLYSDIQLAVKKKAAELYPAPLVELPSGKAKLADIETDYNKRVGFIDNQLNKLTSEYSMTGGVPPEQLGTAIQNLVLAKETAVKNALKPEYDSVLTQASKQGALLPAQDTQDLLRTAEDLFQGDPWAKQAPLLKLVKEQSAKFKAMRRQVSPAEPGTNLPTTVAPDMTIGMDITSLDSLKRRVAQDIRETKDLNRQDKLRLLQSRVDEALDRVQTNSGDVLVDFRGEKIPFGQAMANLDTDYYNKIGVPFRDAAAVERINATDYAEKIAPQIATSPTSMRQFLKVAGEDGIDLAEKAVMSKLYNKSLNKNGVIDPNKLEALLTKPTINGGFSDVIDQLPNLKDKLNQIGMKSQYLASEKVAIDDAAREARIRVGQSFLSDYDNMGVEGIVSKMTGTTGKGYRNKLNLEINKLPSDEQINVKIALKNGLVTKMLDSDDPFSYLQKNKDTFTSVFGKDHYDNLVALADVSRLSGKVNIDNLRLRDIAVAETSAIQRMMGGVAPERITGIAVNQISSVFNKAFRIMSLIGKANIDQATKDAHRKLFLDENGVDLIVNASTKLISKKGQEVDLKSIIKPGDASDLAKALGMGALRSGYFGASTAISPSGVVEPVTEPYYQYIPPVE